MTCMPRKHHSSFVTNNQLASANELNAFFTKFETTGRSERYREVLESVTVGSEDRAEISVGEVANVFRHLKVHRP